MWFISYLINFKSFTTQFSFSYSHPTKTYDFLDGNFNGLKKGLKYLFKNPQVYEVIPIELFVNMKNLQNFIEVARKTMLENLTPLNVYI